MNIKLSQTCLDTPHFWKKFNHPKPSIINKVNIMEVILLPFHFPQVCCSLDNIKTHEIKLSEGSVLRRFKRWPYRPVIPEKAFKLPQTCNFELMFLHTIFFYQIDAFIRPLLFRAYMKVKYKYGGMLRMINFLLVSVFSALLYRCDSQYLHA